MRLSRFWKDEQPARAAPSVPDGQRIYAVGDIHGRADLLDAMAGLVARDLAQRPVPKASTIFLGDYVDRGPASAAVVERLRRGEFPTSFVALRGNHEDLLIGFLTGVIDLDYYEQVGGLETLRSYGLDWRQLQRADPSARMAMVHEAVPDDHCAFLDTLGLTATVGDYFFCHAGVRPGVPLDRQNPDDLLWIRDEFLSCPDDLGKVVVHGHTPLREPLVRPNAIGIDTYAVRSGVLTAAVLEGTALRFLRTGG